MYMRDLWHFHLSRWCPEWFVRIRNEFRSSRRRRNRNRSQMNSTNCFSRLAKFTFNLLRSNEDRAHTRRNPGVLRFMRRGAQGRFRLPPDAPRAASGKNFPTRYKRGCARKIPAAVVTIHNPPPAFVKSVPSALICPHTRAGFAHLVEVPASQLRYRIMLCFLHASMTKQSMILYRL